MQATKNEFYGGTFFAILDFFIHRKIWNYVFFDVKCVLPEFLLKNKIKTWPLQT
jgi:hypothetical protein